MKRCSWLIIFVLLFVFGCAEIQPPTPVEFIQHPWGTKPEIRIGMTKEEVIKYWDEPDKKEDLGADRWGVSREKWTYTGKYSDIPLDYKYLSVTKILYFDGNHLTGVDSARQ